jgi:hypothetical protein
MILDSTRLHEAMVEIQERLPPSISVHKTNENFQIVINPNLSVESRMSLHRIVNGTQAFPTTANNIR